MSYTKEINNLTGGSETVKPTEGSIGTGNEFLGMILSHI
jgi:hypothetical protein